MSLVVVGLSHHTSPIALRERLAFSSEAVPNALLRLTKRIDGAGAVILSTCNRVEIYVHHSEDAKELYREIRGFLSEWHGLPEEEFRDSLYEYEGRDAVGHFFRVTASLDSLVVGEAQILGQVHDAYTIAQAEQTADTVLHTLFQKGFTNAKTVRNQTTIGEGKISVSSVAVDLAESIFQTLSGKTVMVLGSGEMGELTLKRLVAKGVDHALVVNRSFDKAQALAEPYRGEPLNWDGFEEHLHRADIVICTTAAPHFILHASQLENALKQRDQRPMFLIDIAVPRNVDPVVGDLDNIYLYNTDDLEQVVEGNLEVRRKEVDYCMTLVDRATDRFMQWMAGLIAAPTIASMTQELDAIRERELTKTLATLPDLTDKQREEVAYLTQRIVQNILQKPMTEIKQEVGHHDPHTVLHLVKRIFGLDKAT